MRSVSIATFVIYGNVRLENRLNAANARLRDTDPLNDSALATARAEINAARAAIRNVQTEIAGTVFFNDYTVSVPNVQNRGGGSSSLNKTISTGINFQRVGISEVLFPVPNVEKTRDEFSWGDIRLSVTGNTARIAELRDNSSNLRARVWFTNLRSDEGTFADSIFHTPRADILRTEIFHTSRPPRSPQPPGGGNPGDGRNNVPPQPNNDNPGGNNEVQPPRVATTVDYPYTIAASPDGDNSRIVRISAMRGDPNDRFTQPRADVVVSFPPELNVTNVAVAEEGRVLNITVSGQEDDISELVRNAGRWQVRVGFGRPTRNPNNNTVTADALRIELIKN